MAAPLLLVPLMTRPCIPAIRPHTETWFPLFTTTKPALLMEIRALGLAPGTVTILNTACANAPTENRANRATTATLVVFFTVIHPSCKRDRNARVGGPPATLREATMLPVLDLIDAHRPIRKPISCKALQQWPKEVRQLRTGCATDCDIRVGTELPSRAKSKANLAPCKLFEILPRRGVLDDCCFVLGRGNERKKGPGGSIANSRAPSTRKSGTTDRVPLGTTEFSDTLFRLETK